ncbi:MAG TPA: calcium-binding protein [Polyangiaceae bacterium]|nr:calcium-binding protein [Polyangiaceae bacterium]
MKIVHSIIGSAAVFLTATSALASSASVSGGVLTYTAGANETNSVVVTLSGSTYTINDTGATITPPFGSGCSSVNANTVTCTGTIVQIVAQLGNLHDAFWNTTSTPMNVAGGDNNDTIVGGAGADIINGDAGDDKLYGAGSGDLLMGGNDFDQIWGGPGVDYLNGGAGPDILLGEGDDDTIHGGGASGYFQDVASYASAPGAVTVDLAISGTGQNTINAGTDTLLDIQGVYGSNFADFLYGNDQQNLLGGGQGNDELYGRGGYDKLIGNEGDDDLFGGAGDDFLEGSIGNDYLTGEAGLDYLVGDDYLFFVSTSGNDTLVDGAGHNVFRGGPGNDDIWAVNDTADIIQCEGGTDTLFSDQSPVETSVANCESNTQLPGSGAGAATNAYCAVKSIVQTVCAGCHHPGGAAPMSLLTFADTQPLRGSPPQLTWQMMKARVATLLTNPMPPGGLPQPEINAFNAWNGTGSDACY